MRCLAVIPLLAVSFFLPQIPGGVPAASAGSPKPRDAGPDGSSFADARAGLDAGRVAAARELEAEDYWRRTNFGWQWMPPRPSPPPPLHLHPLTLAAFEILTALTALMLGAARSTDPIPTAPTIDDPMKRASVVPARRR